LARSLCPLKPRGTPPLLAMAFSPTVFFDFPLAFKLPSERLRFSFFRSQCFSHGENPLFFCSFFSWTLPRTPFPSPPAKQYRPLVFSPFSWEGGVEESDDWLYPFGELFLFPFFLGSCHLFFPHGVFPPRGWFRT